MKQMTGMQVLNMYLKDTIIEAKANGLSPQEVLDNYDLDNIDPNKLYNVTIEYSDASDDPDEIIEYTEIK